MRSFVKRKKDDSNIKRLIKSLDQLSEKNKVKVINNTINIIQEYKLEKKNNKYDVIIISGSFNRFEFVRKQIQQFFEQETKYKFKYIILDDGNTDLRYSTLIQDFPEITYLKNEKPNGKFGYWKTINTLLDEASKYESNTILQIDDDFLLCDNFLDRLMNIYFNKKNENNNIVCISYHLYGEDHRHQNRWGCNNGSWVDGGGLYDYNFIKKINFSIDPININRWKNDKTLSSGVWQQISQKIRDMKYLVYKTEKSLVKHEGLFWSSLNRQNKINNMQTYLYIDEN